MPVIHGGAAAVADYTPQKERFKLIYERTVVASPEPQLPETISDAFDRFARFRDDWDSYGATPISPFVLKKARQIVADIYNRASLRRVTVPEPKLLAGGDGSLGLLWSKTGGDLEVSIDEANVDFLASRAGKVVDDGQLNSGDELLARLQEYVLRV